MVPSSAAIPAAITLTSLAHLLGPVAILAAVSAVVAIGVVLVGVLAEHRDAADFQRLRDATSSVALAVRTRRSAA